MMGVSISIDNKSKSKPPRLPFKKIFEDVFKSSYTLSLVFIDSPLSKKLNLSYRKKNKEANVLSFPLDKSNGEIFINLSLALRESPLYKRSYRQHVGLLFIHGLFHLKGYSHGSTMERKEKQLREKFDIEP